MNNKKTILITGGAGFIGSHLTDGLIKNGYKVIVIDNLSTGKKENLNPKAKFYKIDILSLKIAEIFKKENPLAVFHLAAQINLRKSVENPILDAKINILGSLNIIQNFINNSKFKIQNSKFIFSSTGGAIYGDANIIPTPENYSAKPISPYGIAKLSIDNYLYYYKKVFNLNFVSLRYPNVYGPRQNSKGEAGAVAIFCDKILKGEKAIINGNGKQTRDYIYIDDIVEANILALEKKAQGIFNVGTGKEISVNELFEKIVKNLPDACLPNRRGSQVSGKKIQAEHGPAKKGEQKRSCLNSNKIKQKLGWKNKIDLEKGLKKTIDWYRVNR